MNVAGFEIDDDEIKLIQAVEMLRELRDVPKEQLTKRELLKMIKLAEQATAIAAGVKLQAMRDLALALRPKP